MFFNYPLVLLLYQLIIVCLSSDLNSCGFYCDCGPPAIPPETSIVLKNKNNSLFDGKTIFENNSKIKYKCIDSINQLIGSETRSCHLGKWLGSVPRCALSVRNNTRLTLVSIFLSRIRIFYPELSTDDDFYESSVYSVPYYLRPDDCLNWRVNGDQIWVFKLNRNFNINYVKLTLYANNLRQIWSNNQISIQLKLDSSAGLKCSNVKHNLKTNSVTLEFICDTQLSVHSQIQSIYVNFKAKHFLRTFGISLCDLSVYQFPSDCGSPDYTLSTRATNHIHNIFTFQCNDSNHMIKGNSYVECNPNGKWSADSPICVPKTYCKLINNNDLKNNLIVNYEEINVAKDGDHVVYDGKLAYFSCNYSDSYKSKSMKFNGMTQVICRKGEWFGLSSLPFCETLVKTNADVKASTDRFTVLTMGGIIAILSIPTIVLIKRSINKRRKVFRHDLNLYDDNQNADADDHYYAEIDYWDIQSKNKSKEEFKSQEEINNDNNDKCNANCSNIYVE